MCIIRRLPTVCIVFCVMAKCIPINSIKQRARIFVVIVVSMIMMIITTLNTLAGHCNSLRTQATSKLLSPSAVQFVQGYRLQYVCRGFVQAQAWRRSAVRLVLLNV